MQGFFIIIHFHTSLIMLALDDYRSTKANIFKLSLDFSLKLWLFDVYEYRK